MCNSDHKHVSDASSNSYKNEKFFNVQQMKELQNQCHVYSYAKAQKSNLAKEPFCIAHVHLSAPGHMELLL